MKNYIFLTMMLAFAFIHVVSCEKKTNSGLDCQDITLGEKFNAKINETWCLGQAGWKITFGPFIEDSRCNVTDIDCVWAGRYVMGAEIDNGDPVQDTFFAVNSWRDTIYSGPYQIILDKVYPETRQDTGPLDPSAYSFDVIVK